MDWKLQNDVIDGWTKDGIRDWLDTTTWFTTGENVKAFEKAWAEWQGCKYCVMVNSGTSANILAVRAVKEVWGIPDGSEVIVPAVTWGTTVAAVVHAGLIPKFVDVNLEDFSFNYDELGVTRDTRMIFPTHVLGFPANMTEIMELAERFNLRVVEDCCEAIGARHRADRVGSFGDASTFSFYWGHHITTIEGGMVCTDNQLVYKNCLLNRAHGLERELPDQDSKDFKFLSLGYNFRSTEFNAIVGLSQIPFLNKWILQRKDNYQEFRRAVEGVSGLWDLPTGLGACPMALPFLCRNSQVRDELTKKLEYEGVETRSIIGGNLLRHPAFSNYGDPRNFPNAEVIHNGFYIGNNQFLTEDDFANLRACLLR